MVVGWGVVVALMFPLARRAEDGLDVSTRIAGAPSAEVPRILASRFHSAFAYPVIVVVAGVPVPREPDGRSVLVEIQSTLKALPFVKGTFSYVDAPAPWLLGTGGQGTAVVVGLEEHTGRPESLVPPLREWLRAEQDRLRARFPNVSLLVTGEPAINYDLWHTSTLEARKAEIRSLPLTLGLLVLAFGNVWSAGIPLVVGVSAVVVVRGLVFLLSRIHPLSILVINVATMLGLALGIDYALLTVSRFREAAGSGASWSVAAHDAMRHAGRTVCLSGIAVLVGFVALLPVGLDELRSCAVGGILVVVVAVGLSATLVPGLLCLLGARIGLGRPFGGDPAKALGRWRAWGLWVGRHPLPVLAAALLPLGALAVRSADLSPRIPDGNWLPRGMESAEGLRALAAMGRGGLPQALRIVIQFPEDTQSLSLEGWAVSQRVEGRLLGDPRVDSVQSIGRLNQGRVGDLAAVSLLPPSAKRTYLSEEGDGALVEVIPRDGVDHRALMGLVRELRQDGGAAWTGRTDTRLLVGGLPAFDVDYEDAVSGRVPLVVGLVVLGSLVALFASFRSVLVPLKAVALNLLSVAAAFGALVVVFQEGFGGRVLGLEHGVSGVFPIVPPLVFCTVFGLSMDYEVFLVARVREARLAGAGDGDAIAEGLARTGGLITSAASIMVGVFLTFTLGDVLVVKMLGFTLAVAVLFDATLVRVALGPAVLRLAGAWNWWPGAVESPGAGTDSTSTGGLPPGSGLG
jgi:RND superfamily putative drug exporter